MLYLYPTMQRSVMSFEFSFFFNFNENFKTYVMLDFFLELEVLWLLKMLLLINNAINYILQF